MAPRMLIDFIRSPNTSRNIITYPKFYLSTDKYLICCVIFFGTYIKFILNIELRRLIKFYLHS